MDEFDQDTFEQLKRTFQILSGRPPSAFESDVFAQIFTDIPELMLPLFHFAQSISPHRTNRPLISFNQDWFDLALREYQMRTARILDRDQRQALERVAKEIPEALHLLEAMIRQQQRA